jgi:hypothetical protein
MSYFCPECNLVDPYNGDGDGIGSCDCPRMECCGCGNEVSGTRGFDWSVQHRLARKGGGTNRPWVNRPPNLITVCGHGTAGCHGRIESERIWAEGHGLIVREGVLTPERWPLDHAMHGLVWLLDDGGWLPR